MSKYIYSDIRGEVVITEFKQKRVYIYDREELYNPNLVLPNITAVQELRNYLNEIIEKEKK